MSELMTMRDIAGLARVQRPVVTMWRRRSRATAHPFPAPQQLRGGQELFLRDEVVTWLEDTRRGNNPDARADAASHSLLATGSVRDAEVLSALLALRHLIGAPLAARETTVDDLLDLADAHDPDDHYLFAELQSADDLINLARVADELVESSWNATSAHHRLMDARLRTPGSALAQVALTDRAQRHLLTLLGPLTRELGGASVMDPTGCAVDVVAELASALESDVLLMDGATPVHRLTRRQVLLADRPLRIIERGDRDWSVTGPVAHLVVLPSAAEPTASPVQHLDLLDEIALQLDERQLVLCLAPAANLADPLEGESLARRDQLLRDGYVRAIVRLPAGMRPAQAREHSALWLMGPADPTPPAERRTLVADLAGGTLRDADGVADDLLAAWQGADGARRRAWAHLYAVPTRDLISASATLVPPRRFRVAPPARTGADWAVSLRESDTVGRLAGYRLDVADGSPEIVTIAQAMERGWVRILPGRRIDVDGLPAGNVRVLSVPLAEAVETQPFGSAHVGFDRVNPRGIDRLALLSLADVELTEPGDIVFTIQPSPKAIIDLDGGSLVLYPARVLRLRPNAPLVARSVLARVNAATSTAWRTWTLATVPEPDRTSLGEALADLAGERARLVAELAALDVLTNDLTQAVESRQLSITKENHGPTSL